MEGNEAKRVVPERLVDLRRGTILRDRHRRDYYEAVEMSDDSIAPRQDELVYRVPCSLFVSLYDRRLFPIEHATSIDPPVWSHERPESSIDTDRPPTDSSTESSG